MNIDPKLLNQLSGINQKDLSDKIDAVSKLLGVNPNYIRNIIGTPEDMQKMLKSMSEEDIKNMSQKIDPELMKKLNCGDDHNGK